MIRRPPLSSLLLLSLPWLPLSAQATWSPVGGGKGLDLRLTKAFYEEGGPDFATFTVVPTVRFPASATIDVEVELPISRASQEDPFFEETYSGTVVGNPYVGIGTALSPSTRLRAGIRLGVFADADDLGAGLAVASALIQEFDRSEAFLADVHTLRGVLEFGQVPERGAFGQLRVGASVLLATGDAGSDTEALLDYGVRFGARTGSVVLHGGVTGRANVTSDDGSLAERTIHQLVAGLEATGGQVRPVVEFRYFLDEGLRDAINGIVTLGVRVGF